MYHQGFYLFFLMLGGGLAVFMVFLFGIARGLASVKSKPKRFRLVDFRALLGNVKSKEEALNLVEMFMKKFSTIKPESKEKDEWLESIRELASLELIDTDQAAEIRERLIAKNPKLQKEILDCVGMALKNKKD